MKITPLDIQHKVFDTQWRGYNKPQVDQFLEELGAPGRGSPNQVFPDVRGAGAARQQGLTVTDLEHAAEEIHHIGIVFQTLDRDFLAKQPGGGRVQP